MRRKNIIAILFGTITAVTSCTSNQSFRDSTEPLDYYEKCRRLVLSENAIGQEYIFKISKQQIDELHVSYLGYVKTNKGDTLKFLNSINLFGQYEDSKRANGAVMLYKDGDLVGAYYVGGELEVPSRIENGNLIFDYNNSSCNQKTSISFKDSIPKQIFVTCTEKGGDIYNLSKH
jgi:hypothetical protein